MQPYVQSGIENIGMEVDNPSPSNYLQGQIKFPDGLIILWKMLLRSYLNGIINHHLLVISYIFGDDTRIGNLVARACLWFWFYYDLV